MLFAQLKLWNHYHSKPRRECYSILILPTPHYCPLSIILPNRVIIICMTIVIVIIIPIILIINNNTHNIFAIIIVPLYHTHNIIVP